MLEPIHQRHRERAASALRRGIVSDPRSSAEEVNNAKLHRVINLILDGKADEHPSVQGAAFYEAHPDRAG